MKKILVTGAGGYIGSVLVPTMLESGYEIIALDRFFFGKDTLPVNAKGIKILEEDIRQVDKSVLKGVYGVIDLAALSNDVSGELDPAKTWSINHLGRVRIAKLAKMMGVKRYILPSSCSVYGFQDVEADETSRTNPLTTYAKANKKAEEDISALAGNGFCVTIARQATVYGLSKRMRFDLAINGMVRGMFKNKRIPILKDGTQWRPFIHVKDVSNALCMIMESEENIVNKEVFNLGSNEQNYQIFDLARRIAKATGSHFEYEWYGNADNRSYKVRFDKARKALKFKPTYDAEKGAKEVWDALNEHVIDPDDARTITVEWYKKLIAMGVSI